MNVNIVCTNNGPDHVLWRLAQTLADQTGWTLSRTPNGGADFNYWILYISFAEKWSDWRQTPVGAWFSHFERGTPFKEYWWELAASVLGLRITCAPQYLSLLDSFGRSAIARPPIDPIFQPKGKKAKHDTPLVGVSGYVDKSKRKGEKLVAQLSGSDLDIELTATGRGWPCRTNEMRFAELPQFYNDIDVLLCPSLQEGIPLPPLEALACGTPVVIPEAVGLLDDLPDIPGIYRYPAGNYGEMESAVRAAVKKSYKRDALIEAVAEYTPENWAADHENAIALALTMGTAPRLESDRHGLKGVYYVAYGDPARQCAQASISSFKEHMPDIPVMLAAEEGGLGEDLLAECEDRDIGGRYAKTLIYDLAPKEWQYIMYLDADTEVIANINFLYEALSDGWDMVICKNPAKFHIASRMRRSDNKDECAITFDFLGTEELIQLNGGVFAFQRNERTRAFFHSWHEEWQKFCKRDQAALLRALWKHPIKFLVLDNYPWNLITRYDDRTADACILHRPMTARRWRGTVSQRSDSTEAWATVKKWEQAQGK